MAKRILKSDLITRVADLEAQLAEANSRIDRAKAEYIKLRNAHTAAQVEIKKVRRAYADASKRLHNHLADAFERPKFEATVAHIAALYNL